jgi:hypothetical protein
MSSDSVASWCMLAEAYMRLQVLLVYAALSY